MDEWNVESWNNFDNDETPAGKEWNEDDVVSVLVVEDVICPRCHSSRIIANWMNPKKMCCVDCGIIFDYQQN